MDLTAAYIEYLKKVNPELEVNGNLLVKLMDTTNQVFVPQRKHPSDAGFDCRARLDEAITLQPGERALIPLGFAINIPMHYTGDIRPRSGMQANGLVAGYGTVDTGYTGEVKAIIFNFSDYAYTIQPEDRIAQLVVSPLAKPASFTESLKNVFRLLFRKNKHKVATMKVVDELVELDRGANGFGSTGVA